VEWDVEPYPYLLSLIIRKKQTQERQNSVSAVTYI